MLNRYIFYGLIFSLVFLVHCRLFEPEHTSCSLRIVLIKDTTNTSLQKSAETLSSVRCIAKKGTQIIYDSYLTLQGYTFHGEITGLVQASDYSVLLYGENSSSNIISRGYKSGIEVIAGQQTTVTISWLFFTPELIYPHYGDTISIDELTFEWGKVSGAIEYGIMIDRDSTFNNPLIHEQGLTISNYEIPAYLTTEDVITGRTYYWRVQAKDSEGTWSNWSETWIFSLTKGPVLSVTPDSLNIDSNNPLEMIYISNIGNDTLTWSVSADKSWIIMNPSEGETTSETAQIYVTVSTSGSRLNLRGNIIVTSNGGSDTVSVRVITSLLYPKLSVFPSSLDFGSYGISKTVTITNSGTGTLSWSVNTSDNWITVNPSTGSTTTEENHTTVTVNRKGLTTGDYSGKVTVDSNGGTEIVSVSMRVEGNK